MFTDTDIADLAQPFCTLYTGARYVPRDIWELGIDRQRPGEI